MRARRAERQRRVDVPAADGLAARLRRDARPRRRALPARARRRVRAGRRGATCRARWSSRRRGARARGWIIVRDVLLHRAVAPRDGALAHAPPLADRLRRRPRPAAHDALRQRRGRDPPGVRAGLRLRPRAGATGSTRATATTRAYAARPAAGTTSSCTLTTDLRLGLRGAARDGADDDARRARPPSSRWAGPSTRRRRPTTRPTSGSSGPRDYWHQWLARGQFPDHPWRAHLQRSALTLKGLSYAPTGAMLAAATTSLPGDAAAASATGTTATRGSATPRSCSGASTRSASTGRPTTSSTSSPTWPRRRRASSRSCTASAARRSSTRRRSTTCRATRARARCGSATAPTTRTSTTSGARCSTRSTCTRSRATRCPSGSWPILKNAGRGGDRRTGASPTAGIWEVRGEPKHFTSSKIMCWVALDRGARLAGCARSATLAAQWQQVADEIHADICEHGVDERGVFTQHYDTDALDASRPAHAARALPAARRRAHLRHRATRSPTS